MVKNNITEMMVASAIVIGTTITAIYFKDPSILWFYLLVVCCI